MELSPLHAGHISLTLFWSSVRQTDSRVPDLEALSPAATRGDARTTGNLVRTQHHGLCPFFHPSFSPLFPPGVPQVPGVVSPVYPDRPFDKHMVFLFTPGSTEEPREANPARGLPTHGSRSARPTPPGRGSARDGTAAHRARWEPSIWVGGARGLWVEAVTWKGAFKARGGAGRS